MTSSSAERVFISWDRLSLEGKWGGGGGGGQNVYYNVDDNIASIMRTKKAAISMYKGVVLSQKNL